MWKVGEWGEARVRWRAHNGSPVWCLDTAAVGGKKRIFSGGGDCGVRCWSLDGPAAFTQVLRLDFEAGDYPKVVRLWAGRLLCLSNEGHVVSFDDQGGKSMALLLFEPFSLAY